MKYPQKMRKYINYQDLYWSVKYVKIYLKVCKVKKLLIVKENQMKNDIDIAESYIK